MIDPATFAGGDDDPIKPAWLSRRTWADWLIALGWRELAIANRAFAAASLLELARECRYDERTGHPSERPFGRGVE